MLTKATEIKEWLVDIRRDFHRHPEPSMQEVRTAEVIERQLNEMGLEVTRIGTGVLGVLQGGQPGKTIALRADIDALSVEEKTEVSYRSLKPGFMHACGHDAHAAMLLGAARLLSAQQKDIKGTIKFIFQPGEEVAQGAKAMIAGGVMENPKVDMVVGMHIFAMVETGKMIVQPGPFMAAGDVWQLTINGKSAHGSSPWEGVDAVTCAAAVVQSLQTLVSRVNDARNPIVINVGTIHGGERHNVIPGKVEMTGMNRSFSEYSRKMMPEWMEQMIKNICGAYNCSYELTYEYHCSPVNNNPEVCDVIKASVGKIIGAENIHGAEKIMGSEDFAEYMKEAPGAMIILGGGNQAKGCWHSQHSNYFAIDEDSLPIGAASYAQIAADFLK